jgi:two-component system response regulator ChvI
MSYAAKPAQSAGRLLTRTQFGAGSDDRKHRNRLIFIDDDAHYREVVKAELQEEGFSVTDFPSGEAMLDSLEDGSSADVIVLDWNLEKTSGIDLLPMFRERGFDLPVVFLTGRSTPVHERLALERGAVDFVDKSRGVEVLTARLRLIAGNTKRAAESKAVRHGDLLVEPAAGRASWKGINVDLTVSEFRLVVAIATNGGKYVNFRALYDAIHYRGFMAGSGEHGYRANVRSSIRRIRKKFQDCDPTFDEIRNYTGFGYCWGKPSD